MKIDTSLPIDLSSNSSKSMNYFLQHWWDGHCYHLLWPFCSFDHNWLSNILGIKWEFFNWPFFFFLCFLLKADSENSSPIVLIFACITMFYSIILIFFVCELGQMTSNEFSAFDEELCQLNWHAFPIKMQKVLVIFMSFTQRQTILSAYGLTECTRDAFKTVWTTFNLQS